MAYDIQTSILNKLVSLFTAEFATGAGGDPDLALNLCELAPFQDDPTEQAPYIIVGIDPQQGRIIDPIHDIEIGGGVKWMNFISIVAGTPMVTTKAKVYEHVAKFNDAILRVLFTKIDLDSLVSANGERIQATNEEMIDADVCKVFGGETTWFGQARIDLHFFSEETPGMRGL